MAEYLHPGVYVEEVATGPRPIEGVPTSVAAFIGATERGPVWPVRVSSFNEYARHFGGEIPEGFLPHAVRGFFENGGTALLVCRVAGAGASTACADLGDFELRATGPGGWAKRLWIALRPGSTLLANQQPAGFRISAAYFAAGQELYDPFDRANDARMPRPQYAEDHDDLSIDALSPDYFATRLQGHERPVLFTFALKPGVAATGSPPAMRPGGPLDAQVTLNEPQGCVVLDARDCDDVALVYAPDADEATQRDLVRHCEQSRRRFALLDIARGVTHPDTLHPRTSIGDSSYAASYWPWLWVEDAAGARVLVPPGGHVAGIYARIDVERGVHKAPANEVVRGALALEYVMDDIQQETLNPRGVNAIRSFPERGIRVWGARTLSSNSVWKYVNVRRLSLYLETSIALGLRWTVFEPNDERLWARVTDTIRQFLRASWRTGALMGSTEDHAFFVLCGRDTMTQVDILEGRLICEIGIAPTRPAEFVIFRLFQHTAEMRP